MWITHWSDYELPQHTQKHAINNSKRHFKIKQQNLHHKKVRRNTSYVASVSPHKMCRDVRTTVRYRRNRLKIALRGDLAASPGKKRTAVFFPRNPEKDLIVSTPE
jgi:hypothetical protein